MIDNDPRTPDQQYTDFITRPGTFHQLHITIHNTTTGAPTTGECIIKYTPAEQPLIIEVLRQIRGALNATITIAKCEPPPHEDPERRRIADQHNVPIDRVQRAPSPTGDTAWTITPAPRPTHGRHAKPDTDNPRCMPDYPPAISCCGGGPQWGHAWTCPTLP